jgi:hypothetical protein
MQLYTSDYIGNLFLRFLYNFFVQLPLQLWFRFITAYWPSSATFINYTNAPEAVLQQQWLLAQQGIAETSWPTSIGGPLHAPDPRALTVTPKHVTVVSVPDVSLADLSKINAEWAKHTAPSGTILVISGSGFLDYATCHSYACPWRKPRVYAAASEIPVTLSYEFQNIILSELGYDVSGR